MGEAWVILPTSTLEVFVRCPILTVSFVVATASFAQAAEYHVALTGDDESGDGSPASPFRTIDYAVNQAIPAEGGHTILVADGIYEGTVYLHRGFPNPVVIRAANSYRAKLTNVQGENEAVRIYVMGTANITLQGFIISNAHESYTCPDGRESYYLIHIQDADDVALVDNIIFGNNAPGRCNELLKINRGSETAYPRNILVEGNVFYDPANAEGSDMIDSVRPGELRILGNIFWGNPEHDRSQSFITLKRQAPPPGDPSSPRYEVSRNIFFHWGGKSDQAFVQFGEDGVDFHEITDALVENNLCLGDSSAFIVAPFQFKGSQGIRVQANTIVGDLPGGSFGFRIGTEGSNPQVSDFGVRNNIWSDPTGTMTDRLINTYGDVLVSSVVLDHNLYWNADQLLPSTGSVTPDSDINRVIADPLFAQVPDNIVLPRWNEQEGAFPSGSTSIAEEFLRLVEAYGAIAPTSPARDVADPAHMPAQDIRGLPRDSNPDIGAYEYIPPGSGGAGGTGTGGAGAGEAGAGGAGAGETGVGGAGAGETGVGGASAGETGAGGTGAGGTGTGGAGAGDGEAGAGGTGDDTELGGATQDGGAGGDMGTGGDGGETAGAGDTGEAGHGTGGAAREPAAKDDGGCGCRMAGAGGERSLALLGLAIAGLWHGRRRAQVIR